jgi:hypothetical protein
MVGLWPSSVTDIISDGLSIPFFTLGRTLSMRQTLSGVPEWLQSTRRMDRGEAGSDPEASGDGTSEFAQTAIDEGGGERTGCEQQLSETVPMDNLAQAGRNEQPKNRVTNVRRAHLAWNACFDNSSGSVQLCCEQAQTKRRRADLADHTQYGGRVRQPIDQVCGYVSRADACPIR